jgi:phosphotransferase system IIB component
MRAQHKLFRVQWTTADRDAARGKRTGNCSNERKRQPDVEVVKALAALQPLYGKDNIEIITEDGTRVRGVVKSMKTTQALTKPSVKIQRADGEIVKITFDTITEIVDHNPAESVR